MGRTSGGGTVTRIGEKRYLIKWHQGRGRPNIRKVIHGTRETAGRALQTLRERFYGGLFGWPQQLETKVRVLTQLVVADYKANNYKSLKNAEQLHTFWNAFAGNMLAETVSATDLRNWATEWRENGLSPARVNRRMSFLLRAYRLGLAGRPPLVTSVPQWTKLKESPPRSGYRSWQEFVKVRALLPPHARIPVTIEYWLGTREGETMSLEWAQVYLDHQKRNVEIRLASETTKTEEERVAVMGGDLYDVLAAWYKQTSDLHPDCRWVCHLNGRKLASIKSSWRTACVKAGLGRFENPKGRFVGNRRYRGALIHDFRRTAVSNMEDAGVPRKVAMAISGHKSDSVYRRYHIVKRSDLVEAGRRLLEHHERKHSRGEQLVNSSGSERSAGTTRNP